MLIYKVPRVQVAKVLHVSLLFYNADGLAFSNFKFHLTMTLSSLRSSYFLHTNKNLLLLGFRSYWKYTNIIMEMHTFPNDTSYTMIHFIDGNMEI